MFTENHPIQTRSFSSGASYDTDPIKVFAGDDNGKYIDAHNMEPTSNDGKTGSLQKIKGESLLYGNTTGLTSYKCVGSASVNSYLVEFWAKTGNFPGIVRVNGDIVLSSTNFKIQPEFPLQIDKSESAFNECFITSGVGSNLAPFVFDIKDMVDSFNAASNKYFAAFDPLLYQVNIQSALDTVAFIELINVGGGGGGPVGHYQYQIRYSTNDGDLTQWSHPSPMIPIVESLSSSSREYPWVKTYGAAPSPESVTSFAPHLRFRVTNLYNYDFIEVKRIAYNQGAGIQYTPTGTIVAKIAVAPGEISVKDYIDWQQSNVNIPITETDDVTQLAHIKSAGAIRYFDRRLVFSDIELESKEADPAFDYIGAAQGFPIIENLGTAGHKDTWNHVYRKSEMRGEKSGWGVNFYDCVGNKGFVSKIPSLKNYQFPNRRDFLASATRNYSYNGTVKATTVHTRSVDQTHEVFDLTAAVQKTNVCDFKNVIQRTGAVAAHGGKPKGFITPDCSETNGEIENHGANVSTLGFVSTAYLPYHPVSKNDSDVTGHNYLGNNKVSTHNIITAGIAVEDSSVKYNEPLGFGPYYYSMGIGIGGMTNIPIWAKAFSVVRTPSAGRVVCQGLAYYSLRKAVYQTIGNNGLGGKELNKFWFYAPDIDHGIVSSEMVNDIIDNPQNYKLQFVSPLGFFSEFYSAQRSDLFSVDIVEQERSSCIDMITYARMLRDETGYWKINRGETAMGVTSGDYSYVDYEIFRNTGSVPTPFSGNADKGNRIFNLSSAKRKSEGRGDYLEITTDETIYANIFSGGISDTQFEDTKCRDWTEPLYVVNIIRTGAEVKDIDTQPYKATPHYQKIESIIGKSSGVANQVFKLVDERWDDCIPAPKSTYYGASTDRFLYIKLSDGITIQKWVNVTYYTAAQVANLVANISFAGGAYNGISGCYTHTNVLEQDRFFEINFNVAGSVPPLNSLITVRYDKDAPMRVFGGDTYLGEAIFAPIDRQASAEDKQAETQFSFGIGLPYKSFKLNPRYYTINKAGASINEIQQHEWFDLAYIRQLCVMFTCESRSAIHLAHSDLQPSQNQFFPQVNYIIRPNRWDNGKSITDNNIFQQYANDYGDGEKDIWKYGGLRFKQLINPDYSVASPLAFFSKPAFGFVEQLHYPNMSMWSLQRGISQQNSPGLKTFPANNSYIIDDGHGKISYLWVDTTDKGENLYAIADKGICILLTKKTILSDLNSGNIGYMAATQFIGGEYWLSKDTGCPDKLWRGISDARVPIQLQDGAQIINKALFFLNNQSIFRLMDNQVTDIGRIDYHSRIYPDGLSKIKPALGTDITAIFDNYKQQYYIFIRNVDDDDNKVLFVFSQKNGMWFGTNDFNFEKFTAIGNKTYGHKNLITYELNVGQTIGGNPIKGTVTIAHAPESIADKEMIRVRINSNVKPVLMEFFKSKEDVITDTVQCGVNASNLKNYRGYEQYVPRIDSSVNANRPRFQGKLIITKISHNLAEDFVISDFSMQYKKIKT